MYNGKIEIYIKIDLTDNYIQFMFIVVYTQTPTMQVGSLLSLCEWLLRKESLLIVFNHQQGMYFVCNYRFLVSLLHYDVPPGCGRMPHSSFPWFANHGVFPKCFGWIHSQQECIPVGCVPPAAVAVPGALHQAPPGSSPPKPGTPQEQTPQTRHPPAPPPGPGTPRSRPPREQAAPVDRITDACENITLPRLRCGR